MLFSNISLIDENMKYREKMYLGTEGERITYIGETEPENAERFGEVYHDCDNKLLLPAFYDGHSHFPMYLLRGYGENLSLQSWLNTRIFPYEAKLNDEAVYAGTMLSCAEALRFGIAGANEMYMFANPTCSALRDSRMKMFYALCVTWFDKSHFSEIPIFAEGEKMLSDFPNTPDGRLKVSFSLHSEYTTTERIAREMAEYVKERNLPMHIHVSETKDEVDICRTRHQGRSPVQYLYDCGMFDTPTIAAHCVHIDDRDIELMREKKVSVSTNPKANLKLASGVCPATKLLSAGVNLALGTDSVASNNNLNMLEEMKFFALIHKGTLGDPKVITPEEALYAATRAGALSQGREDCGFLKEGFRADITMMDIDRVYMYPRHNMLSNLVYSGCGSDICMTMVDGEVLYKDGEYRYIDVEKERFNADKQIKRILSELEADRINNAM